MGNQAEVDLMKPGDRRMALPCVLHLPDMGSVRITCSMPGATLDYDAWRIPSKHQGKPATITVGFPAATAAYRRGATAAGGTAVPVAGAAAGAAAGFWA